MYSIYIYADGDGDEIVRPLRMADVVIFLTSALVWLAAQWVQIQLIFTFDYVQGISLLYIPAGVRLLVLLAGRFPAMVGIFGANAVSLSWALPSQRYGLWPQLLLAGFSSFVPYLALRVAKQWLHVAADLKSLKPKHLLVLALAVSVASPLVHCVWFLAHGEMQPQDLPLRLPAMMLGDFLGIGVVLGIIVLLRMGFVRISRSRG